MAYPQQKSISQFWRLGFHGRGVHTVRCWGGLQTLDFSLWQEKGERALRGPFFKKLYFIEVSLVYNVVLISAVQQSDSVILTYTFFFIFFSIMIYHRILNIVPCAIW